MSDALVLAGGGAKGAFAAGALAVLSDPDVKAGLGLDVTRIVGTSAGALSGVYYAAAIRAGQEAWAGERLTQLWLDDASIGGAFDFSLRDVLAGVGLSTDARVLGLLRQHVPPSGGGGLPIELRLVITNVDGEPVVVDGQPATTFEHVVAVAGEDFDTAASLERVFVATAASAALPGAYSPVSVEADGGPFRGLDGGLVDDTPLGHALADAPNVTRVFVVAPFPRLRVAPAALHGLSLASHILEILAQGRLVRDLRHAARVNRVLSELPLLVPDAVERAALLDALGWTGRRVAQIVEIRPAAELPGDGFSGFASRDQRQQYVQAGVDAARSALAPLP